MKKILALFFFLWLVCNNQLLNAYDVETHRELAQRATDPEVSFLDQALKNDLNEPKGVEQEFLGREVRLWIGEGAASEDSPPWRVLNHFHNPVSGQWDNAGLDAFGGRARGQSSVLWQQNASQNTSLVFIPNLGSPLSSPFPLFSLGGNRSWQDTRQEYLTALTGENKTGREIAFAHVFRNLGHLTHLVQDATVPAHVRNDPHPPGNSDWYEGWAEKNPNTVNQFINLPTVRPTSDSFPPTMHNLAPIPIARLIDNNLFNGTNLTALSDPDIGVSEYTNGNFLSRNTIFKDFALPRPFSLDLNNFILEPVGTKWRRYFRKVGEGESVDHFVTEGLLFESLLAARGGTPPPSGGWTMDDRVQEDYGRLLLPRAVGYSASLLDYFFRGKLDVDLLEDPVDPSIVHLEGVNASSDKLDGGSLILYADDPNSVRSPLVALDPTEITVDPDQPLSSARFQITEEAERFIAVYKGKLGDETPDGDFVGGVIGKAIGGVRVEQLFKDSVRWYIRTPQGVFPLPILVQDVDDLQWGDNDNTIVGRSRFGPGNPNQFYAYKIKRPVGSLEIPLTSQTQPDGGQLELVDVGLLQQIPFPFGVSAGTTVQFSHTLNYKQHFLWFTETSTSQWVVVIPDDPDQPGNQEIGHYELVSTEIDGQVSLLVDEVRTRNLSYSIVLDPGTLPGGSVSPPYLWELQEIRLTKDGRILALVGVRPLSTDEPASFPVMELQVPSGADGNTVPQPVEVDQVEIGFFYPTTAPILWLLVDIGDGKVVASTAPSNVQISHETARTKLHSHPVLVAIRRFGRARRVGGPSDGFRYGTPAFSDIFPDQLDCTPEQLNQMVLLGDLSIENGSIRGTINQYRSEISSLQFPPLSGEIQTETLYPRTCGDAGSGISPSGFRVNSSANRFGPTELEQVLRPILSSGSEQLVLLMMQGQGDDTFSRLGKIVDWSPVEDTVEVRHQFGQGFHFASSVSPDAALIITFFPDFSGATTLVALNGDLSAKVFPGLFLFNMRVLEPDFLYNQNDLKFYTKDMSPRRTPLPAALATVIPNPRDRYHVVTVK